MRVEILTDLASLERIAASWRSLPLPTPMQSPAWLLSWWEAFGEEDPTCELLTLAFYSEEGPLIGLAPWYTRRHPVAGRTLRFLGDGRASTDHHTLLCHAQEEQAFVTAAARWLIDSAGEAWQRLRFEAMDDDNRAMDALERLLKEANLDTERIGDLGSFPAELTEAGVDLTWEQYLQSLSKNRRKRMRRWQRAWFDTGRATVRVVKTEAERQELWPLLVRLHRERREGMGEQGVYDCPRFNRFHELASAKLLAQGELYFALLEIDGAPAAIEYAPQDAEEGAIYAYQGGIAAAALDQDAGHLSLMALTRHALTTGRSQLDLLRGDEPYKMNWGASHRSSSTLHVRPRTVAGTVERWVGTAYRRVRDARQTRFRHPSEQQAVSSKSEKQLAPA